MRRAPLAVSLVLASLVLAAPGAARAQDTPIQPGAFMSAPAGCTLNFVFRDTRSPFRLYVGTAGHCVNAVGNVVRDAGGTRIGVVVFRELAEDLQDDFALVEIDAARYAEVNPEVRRWGGPTGHTVASDTAVHDLLLQYGHGIVLGTTSLTRGRGGVLRSDDTRSYRAIVPIIFGDSGGPVLHEPTGKALGVISHFVVGVATYFNGGPTVESILGHLAAAGRPVEVVRAPYVPPV